MDKNSILQYKNQFDGITRHIESEDAKEQIEVWFARELQTILGYARWENFLVAIHRAVASCKSQQINVDDHFREVTKMIIKIDSLCFTRIYSSSYGNKKILPSRIA